MPTSHQLAHLPWPDVADRAARGAVLAVPVGSTEQHGPHLPLSTDTDIAVALCEALADRCDVLVAPPLAYGSSGEHAGFAGTLSIGQAVTEMVLVELGRSARETFAHLLFVSAHGGNAEPVNRAVRLLWAEGQDVAVFHPQWDGDAHAGFVETGLQLVLNPDRTRMDRAVAGAQAPLRELLPDLRTHGVRFVSPNGVLGNPTGATATDGGVLFEGLVRDLVDVVETWLPRNVAVSS